jgi:hypothetical protein
MPWKKTGPHNGSNQVFHALFIPNYSLEKFRPTNAPSLKIRVYYCSRKTHKTRNTAMISATGSTLPLPFLLKSAG